MRCTKVRLARLALLTLLALPAALVLAQSRTDMQPLPAVPPPPPEMAPFDAALEPEVTIKKREGDTVEEHRLNGKLYKIKAVSYTHLDRAIIDGLQGGFPVCERPYAPVASGLGIT